MYLHLFLHFFNETIAHCCEYERNFASEQKIYLEL